MSARIATAVLAAALAGAVAFAGDKRGPAPRVAAAQGETCVAPTDEMRRNHMKYLLHQRDRTMHEGFRDPRFSLKQCIECHADRESGSVLGKDGFCASCHAYAAVKIDCFECHTPLRQKAVRGGAR